MIFGSPLKADLASSLCEHRRQHGAPMAEAAPASRADAP
jgi:hypothetical protein